MEDQEFTQLLACAEELIQLMPNLKETIENQLDLWQLGYHGRVWQAIYELRELAGLPFVRYV